MICSDISNCTVSAYERGADPKSSRTFLPALYALAFGIPARLQNRLLSSTQAEKPGFHPAQDG